MRGTVRWMGTVVTAALAALLLAEPTFARGGGGSGRGNRGNPAPKGGKGSPGAQNTKKKGNTPKGANQSASDYIEEVQRESADESRPAFLFDQRDLSLVRSREDERQKALAAKRDAASKARRKATEQSSHPL